MAVAGTVCTSIFPAYAGVNLVMHAYSGWAVDLPRVCGGEPEDISNCEARRISSPRMRG